MKSLTIAFLVSALCTLCLPNYFVAGTTVKILKCDVENPMQGSASLQELTVSGDTVTGSKLDVQAEVNPGLLSAHITINNEDDDVMFDQTIDFCSMSSNDLFKSYFQSFDQPEFNEGNCPINPGSYSSGQFEISTDDGPEGAYKGTIEVMEGADVIVRIICEAQLD
ncbi:hypothetical protein KPH14_009117 [Odynerus spinipes]|uniref:MD-2-related lipid-recognition domain-containing protein n=1 Tax=Odynerus spinipes TaxID=1348599 RepID=A0AAD9RPS3_9HYME|nr:hypothetical protein KPH14_009117 [Odynerus spinipes]